MSINYSSLQANTTEQLRAAGLPVKFTRAGTNVASSYALQIESEKADEGSSQVGGGTSLLAQTELTHKTLMVAATSKAVQAGDVAVYGKTSFTVTKVNEVAPAGVVLYLRVEVV